MWCKSLKCLEIIMYTNISENVPYKNATGIGMVEVYSLRCAHAAVCLQNHSNSQIVGLGI